ncbi:hypothetical protein E4T39_04466 [Aureobasidium subglaciale]|nr:hypothetical protein E4T39_04466 [Aureobasidium subglaciale]
MRPWTLQVKTDSSTSACLSTVRHWHLGNSCTSCAFAMAAFAIISKAKARGRDPSIAAQAPDSTQPHRVWTLDFVERAYKASLRMFRMLAFPPAPPDCDAHWLYKMMRYSSVMHMCISFLRVRSERSTNVCQAFHRHSAPNLRSRRPTCTPD